MALDLMDAYRRSISAIESGSPAGNYTLLGPVITDPKNPYYGDRAYGRFQVMGKNIPEWTQRVLGKALSKEQFLALPQVQDTVFDHYFGQAVAKYGSPLDAASVWFTGQPRTTASGAASDGGLTGNQYVARFAQGLRLPASGSATPPTTAAGGQSPPAAAGLQIAPQLGAAAQEMGQPQQPGLMQMPMLALPALQRPQLAAVPPPAVETPAPSAPFQRLYKG